jgi:hypothetical protein
MSQAEGVRVSIVDFLMPRPSVREAMSNVLPSAHIHNVHETVTFFKGQVKNENFKQVWKPAVRRNRITSVNKRQVKG